MLTLGSAVLAVINIGVMWAMAHRWRYAWHSNLGLQLLWMPYNFLTKQYGMMALGAIVAYVSLKACMQPSAVKETTAAHSQPQLRRRGTRFSPGRLLTTLVAGDTDTDRAGATCTRRAGPADVRRAGLLSSARGRHAAGRFPVVSTGFAPDGPLPAPQPEQADPGTLVRRQKEPILS